jgi:drug/metabolite transporter (DMT)-like permease
VNGALLIVTAQLSFAVGALFLKKLTGETSPALAAALMLAVAAGATAPLLLLRAGDVRALSGQQIGWVVLASLFWLVIGEVLFSAGVAATDLSHASLLMLTLPVFTALLAILFLGETVSARYLVAAALMLVGSALVATERAA